MRQENLVFANNRLSTPKLAPLNVPNGQATGGLMVRRLEQLHFAQKPGMHGCVTKKITNLPFVPSYEKLRARPNAHKFALNHHGLMAINIETKVKTKRL